MIKPNQLSKCHNAPVVVCEGDAWDVKTVRRGSTYYYGCTECKEACDVAPSSDTPEREKLCDCGTMKSSHKKMYHEKQQTFGEPSSDTNELRQQIGNAMQCDDAEHLKDDTGEACYQCQIDKVMELIATKEAEAYKKGKQKGYDEGYQVAVLQSNR